MEAIGSRCGYRNLTAWQHAFLVADACLTLCDRFPGGVRRLFAAQCQRAAISVPANIAEGFGRRSRADFLRHLRIAHGSLLELETHLLLARRRPMVRTAEVDAVLAHCASVGRLLGGLMRSLEGQLAQKAKAPEASSGAR